MIAFAVSAATAIITALICVVVLVLDTTRRTVRIYERERRRKERQRLHVPIRDHAASKGIDIEDLLIRCGAEGWSEPDKLKGEGVE